MNLLVLSPMVPWPLNHGGRIRIFNVLRERARLHRITLACLSPDAEVDLGPLPQLCHEIVTVHRRGRPLADLALFFARRSAYNWIRYRSRELARRVAEFAERSEGNAIEQVQIELPMMWDYARPFTSIPRILSTQNIETDVIHQLRDRSRNPLKRMLYRVEERRLGRLERRAWEESSACIAVSEHDRAEIAAHVTRPEKVSVIANGVDLSRFAFEPTGRDEGAVLVLGGLDYQPNRDAAEWFIAEVFPALQRRLPSARAVFVGRGTERLTSDDSERGIGFHGDAPDILPWLRSCAVLAVPLRMGGGTRLKVLEAMAAGLPVACTSKACEGLSVEAGVHLAVADTVEGLAGAIAALLADRPSALAMAQRARQLVEMKHNWSSLASEFEKLASANTAAAVS